MRLRVHACAHVCVRPSVCLCPFWATGGDEVLWNTGGICTFRLYVRPYIPPGPLKASPDLSEAGSGHSETGSGLSKAGLGLSKAGSGYSEAGSGLSEAGFGLSDAMDGQMDGWMDGQMDGRMDGRTGCTEFPCILQHFVPSASLRGRCPAYIIATIKK